jgi:hypothetical protein
MPDVPAGKEFAVGITEITKSHQANSTAAGKGIIQEGMEAV